MTIDINEVHRDPNQKQVLGRKLGFCILVPTKLGFDMQVPAKVGPRYACATWKLIFHMPLPTRSSILVQCKKKTYVKGNFSYFSHFCFDKYFNLNARLQIYFN